MDLDGDGHRDVLSGSYWPGDLFLFRGLGQGLFAAGEPLRDARGEPLTAAAVRDAEDADREGLAASPCAVDWDGDGDLDLLVGNIVGHVVLIENEGSRSDPRFAATARRRLQAGGADLRVGGGDAGPTVADWDGDGRWDLIVGAGDGSVTWYRNESSEGEPRLARGQTLLAPTQLAREIPQGRPIETPGRRTKPHAVDWDADGRLDLLVGDYFSIREPEPELSAEQRAQRARLESELEEIETRLSRVLEEQHPEAEQERLLAPIQEEWTRVNDALRPLRADRIPTGRVWLLLRTPRPAGSR